VAALSAVTAYSGFLSGAVLLPSILICSTSFVCAALSQPLSPGKSPLIVMRTSERPPGKPCAEVTGALRRLRDVFGLPVIVDGSPNSLDQNLFTTTREVIYDIKPMSRDQISHLPQFQDFPAKVRNDPELCDVMWEVMGGIPSYYDTLLFRLRLASGQDPKTVVEQFLLGIIQKAVDTVVDARMSDSNLRQLCDLYLSTQKPIPVKELERRKMTRNLPDKVFRQVREGGIAVLEPATSAVLLVLRHGLNEVRSFGELSHEPAQG